MMTENVETPIQQSVRYVTYDANGVLDGCYLQVPPEAHTTCMIAVDEAVALDWPHWRANTARSGVEIAPISPFTPTVPTSVTRRQARQALLLKGLLDKVDPAIAAITDVTQRGMAQIEWEDSQVFERSRPTLISLGEAMGLDSAGLDELFLYAATL